MRARRAAVGALAAVLVGVGAGCTSPSGGERAFATPAGGVVFTDATTRAFNEATGHLAFDGFEFSRRDAGLTSRRAAPLTASGEWPVPPRPAERTFSIRRFDQD